MLGATQWKAFINWVVSDCHNIKFNEHLPISFNWRHSYLKPVNIIIAMTN